MAIRYATGVKAKWRGHLAQVIMWRRQSFRMVFLEKVTPELLPKG